VWAAVRAAPRRPPSRLHGSAIGGQGPPLSLFLHPSSDHEAARTAPNEQR
jgi:hypothetical protein